MLTSHLAGAPADGTTTPRDDEGIGADAHATGHDHDAFLYNTQR